MTEKDVLNDMMDDVIRINGFETEETIRFCELCDTYLKTKEEIKIMYDELTGSH